jgi:hypothetical protein
LLATVRILFDLLTPGANAVYLLNVLTFIARKTGTIKFPEKIHMIALGAQF